MTGRQKNKFPDKTVKLLIYVVIAYVIDFSKDHICMIMVGVILFLNFVWTDSSNELLKLKNNTTEEMRNETQSNALSMKR